MTSIFKWLLCHVIDHVWDIYEYPGGYVKQCERCGRIEAEPF